jgi:F-type H+-transporting ATPase subunit b
MSGWTLTFQVVNFLVLAGLLRRFLFKPVMAMIAKRQEELARASADGERARREAEALRARAEEALAGMEATRVRSRAETAALLERDRRAAVAEARREAEATRDTVRRELEAEQERVARMMAESAAQLAAAIARRLLEQVAAPPVAEAFLARLCEHLEALSSAQLRELLADLNGGELLLATAPPLGSAEGDRWLARIAARLGGGAKARLVADPSLIAGAELRFPHTVLSYCWRDGVDAAREAMVHDAAAR